MANNDRNACFECVYLASCLGVVYFSCSLFLTWLVVAWALLTSHRFSICCETHSSDEVYNGILQNFYIFQIPVIQTYLMIFLNFNFILPKVSLTLVLIFSCFSSLGDPNPV